MATTAPQIFFPPADRTTMAAVSGPARQILQDGKASAQVGGMQTGFMGDKALPMDIHIAVERINGEAVRPMLEAAGLLDEASVRRNMALSGVKEGGKLEVLDCGTGLGQVLLQIYDALGKETTRDLIHFTSYDLNPSSLEELRRRLRDRGIPDGEVDIQTLDGTSTKLPDAKFDVVVMPMCLTLMSPVRMALDEHMRILKPGGRLYATSIYVETWIDDMLAVVRSIDQSLPWIESNDDFQDWIVGAWRNRAFCKIQLEAAGLEDVKVETKETPIPIHNIDDYIYVTNSLRYAMMGTFWTPQQRAKYAPSFQPALRRHLESKFGKDAGPNGEMDMAKTIVLFSGKKPA